MQELESIFHKALNLRYKYMNDIQQSFPDIAKRFLDPNNKDPEKPIRKNSNPSPSSKTGPFKPITTTNTGKLLQS